jgi:hypothetical protein
MEGERGRKQKSEGGFRAFSQKLQILYGIWLGFFV